MPRVVPKEESQLGLTEDGRWLHDGEAATHAGVRRFFHQQIRKDEAGAFYLYNSIYVPEKDLTLEEHVYFSVEDTAYFVESLSVDDDGFVAKLNTGSEVELSADALRQDDQGRVYCRLPAGDEARLLRHALSQLEPHLVEVDDGVAVAVGGASYPILPRG